MQRISCPVCNYTQRLPHLYSGQPHKCGACRATFVVEAGREVGARLDRESDANSQREVRSYTGDGFSARATVSADDRVLVHKGSKARLFTSPALQSAYVEDRETLIHEGILVKVPNAEYLIFARDHEFSSRSRAASVISGTSTNGLLVFGMDGLNSQHDDDSSPTRNSRKNYEAIPRPEIWRALVDVMKREKHDFMSEVSIYRPVIVELGIHTRGRPRELLVKRIKTEISSLVRRRVLLRPTRTRLKLSDDCEDRLTRLSENSLEVSNQRGLKTGMGKNQRSDSSGENTISAGSTGANSDYSEVDESGLDYPEIDFHEADISQSDDSAGEVPAADDEILSAFVEPPEATFQPAKRDAARQHSNVNVNILDEVAERFQRQPDLEVERTFASVIVVAAREHSIVQSEISYSLSSNSIVIKATIPYVPEHLLSTLLALAALEPVACLVAEQSINGVRLVLKGQVSLTKYEIPECLEVISLILNQSLQLAMISTMQGRL